MDSLQHTLDAIVKHLDLLGWHVKQLRENGSGTVAEEIDSGLAAIKDAISELGDDLDGYNKTRDQVREMHELGLIQVALNGEREYQEAMAAAADARSY
jgi:hypothetical protein